MAMSAAMSSVENVSDFNRIQEIPSVKVLSFA